MIPVSALLVGLAIAGAHPLPTAPAVALAPEAAWVKAGAIPVGVDREPVSPAERAAILAVAGEARVLGFGEFTHGGHEPLVARNRWLRALVEHGGFTAIALESGLAQSRRVNDYVLGGPGDAETVVREGFTWTFHQFPANVELVRWLRAWNLAHPTRTVRFYGADLTGGDLKDELGRAAFVIDELRGDLMASGLAGARRLDRRLAPFAGRFDQHAWHRYTPAERAAFRTLVADLRRAFDHHRGSLVARRGERSYIWTRQMIEDLDRLADAFDVWPVADPSDVTGALKVVAVRDRAMADYVLWALALEGPRGRILAFAANGHITKVAFDNPHLSAAGVRPTGMGEHLAAALGDGYRVVLTTPAPKASGNPDGELDRVLGAGRTAPFLLPLAGSSAWWRAPRTTTFGGHRRSVGINPARAADALLFVGPLTPEPTTNAPPAD